jgi:Mce-associated membrane protein
VSLSLYDVLDVEPTASEDEIRAAWKAAIADLGPGDRRFRAYNDAAEVLLDPERRAAYDAELADAAEPEPQPAPEPAPEPEPEPTSAPTWTISAGAMPSSVPERPRIATWLLAVVGLVAAGVLALTIALWVTNGEEEEPVAETEDSASAALTAAEEAAVPVLSYDYRTFDAGVVDAQSYLTKDYRVEHSELMSDLRSDATAQKTVVRAEFKGSGIVRVTDDRADILVLINQVVQKADTTDFVLPVWATLQMVEEDDTWRVDGITNDGAVG